MSKYNGYAQQVKALAMRSREAVQQAEQGFQLARQRYENAPRRDAVNLTPAQQARAVQAEADWLAAQQMLQELNARLPVEIEREMKDIRRQLTAQLERDFSADPARLDLPTLELLKSGILRPGEYQRLMDSAADNPTMMRLIGRYAGQAAQAQQEQDPEAARQLWMVEHQGSSATGGEHLKRLDYLEDFMTRAGRNSGMWEAWEQLCEANVESF